MKNSIIALAVMAASLSLAGCIKDVPDDIVGTLYVRNDSEKNIVYLPVFISKDYTSDSLFSPSDSPWDDITLYTIAPDSVGTYSILEFEKKAIEKNNDLCIFFFDLDTITEVPWERIARENIFLKRVDIHSWKELEDYDFEVAYP